MPRGRKPTTPGAAIEPTTAAGFSAWGATVPGQPYVRYPEAAGKLYNVAVKYKDIVSGKESTTTGKRLGISLERPRTLAQAIAVRDAIQAALIKTDGEASTETVGAFAAFWLSQVVDKKPSQATRRWFHQIVRSRLQPHEAFWNMPIAGVQPRHVQAIVTGWDKEPLSETSKAGYFSVLHVLFAMATQLGRITENPCTRILHAFPEPKESKPLTIAETIAVHQALLASDSRPAQVVRFLMYTGSRITESRLLDKRDYGLVNGQITITFRRTKRYKKQVRQTRTIVLLAQAVELLNEVLADNEKHASTWPPEQPFEGEYIDYIWRKPDTGEVVSESAIRRLLQQVELQLKQASLLAPDKHIHPHKCRKYFVTQGRRNGLDGHLLAQYVGQSKEMADLVYVEESLEGHALIAARQGTDLFTDPLAAVQDACPHCHGTGRVSRRQQAQ